MPNEQFIREVVAAIEAEPEKFDMSLFVDQCCTTFCFAGWALFLSGENMLEWRDVYWNDGSGADADRMAQAAAEALGLTENQAHRLFYMAPNTTIPDLKDKITDVTGITFEESE